MPNSLTTTGLTVAPLSEIVTNLTTALQGIYGVDINVDSDSSDGQALNIFSQAVVDLEDLLVQIYNSFDPDLALGVTLDQRIAINGIQRLGGTFTLTNITVVTDRALTLNDISDDPNQTGYLIADGSGTPWALFETQVIPSAGTYVIQFQAVNPGAILTTPNTITIPVSIVLGVVSVNNPTTYTSLGINEETDAQVKIRRQKSVSISSQGYLAGLLAALDNINGVTSAFIYENITDGVDADSIPGHSIWVIVNGGIDADIAAAIYNKRNAGCGMKGSQSVTITQVDGSPFVIQFDRVTPQNLYIQIHITSLNGIDTPNSTYIKSQLVLLFTPGVFERVNINELSTLIQQIDPNALVVPTVGDGFSTAALGPFTNTLRPTAKNLQFSILSGNISITII